MKTKIVYFTWLVFCWKCVFKYNMIRTKSTCQRQLPSDVESLARVSPFVVWKLKVVLDV